MKKVTLSYLIKARPGIAVIDKALQMFEAVLSRIFL